MSVVHVAVAVILDANREQVLLSLRHPEAHQGGLWEFPGGKVESGESLIAALGRELIEELGIQVVASTPLLEVRHDYPDKSVLLDVCVITDFDGRPQGREGQQLRWVPVTELHEMHFPAANLAIVEAVQELAAPH